MTAKFAATLRAAIVGLALAFLILPAAPLGGMVPIPHVGGSVEAYGGPGYGCFPSFACQPGSDPDGDGDGIPNSRDECPGDATNSCRDFPICNTVARAGGAAVGAVVGGPSGAAIGVIVGELFGSVLC